MSIEELSGELINLARSQPTPGNVRLVALQTMLNARVAEAQTNAAAQQAAAATQQAAAAQQMVAPTQALANFTHALVRATWALFFVGGATVLLTIVQVVLAVQH